MNRLILSSQGFHGRSGGAGRGGVRYVPPPPPDTVLRAPGRLVLSVEDEVLIRAARRSVVAMLAAAAPSLGAHTSVSIGVGVANDPVVTPSVTMTSGSLILANVARGNLANFTGLSGATPHDNKGNPNYTQVGVTEAYSPPNNASATVLYKLVGGTGGSGYQVSAAQGLNGGGNIDEVTILLCEILGGSVVQDFAWNEDTTSHSTTSGSVTTTGPALLVAMWWGESSSSFTSASVSSGWTVIETVTGGPSNIQAAMAVQQVSGAGTYSITWTASPAQGAQMWVAAVQ